MPLATLLQSIFVSKSNKTFLEKSAKLLINKGDGLPKVVGGWKQRKERGVGGEDVHGPGGGIFFVNLGDPCKLFINKGDGLPKVVDGGGIWRKQGEDWGVGGVWELSTGPAR